MQLNEYQKAIDDIQPSFSNFRDPMRIVALVYGLTEELGELVKLFRKLARDGSSINKQELIKELGDVLNYLTLIASHFGIELEVVAKTNVSKLHNRQATGNLQTHTENR